MLCFPLPELLNPKPRLHVVIEALSDFVAFQAKLPVPATLRIAHHLTAELIAQADIAPTFLSNPSSIVSHPSAFLSHFGRSTDCCAAKALILYAWVPMGMSQQVASKKGVFLGVSAALVLGALPFVSKTVRQRENNVAAMRDAAIDAKDAARDSRLRTKTEH